MKFHTIRLQEVPLCNREDSARKARLAFFQKVAKNGMQAVLLAHQAEDLAETVLKRVLEGAHLPFIGGMREIVVQEEGPPIWRPFLSVRKEKILMFLQKRSLSFFQDATNLEPTYLRGRMRSSLFPDLEKTFGKEFVKNLLLLSERTFEFKEYLDRKTITIQEEKEEGECTAYLAGLEPIEARYWIQKKGKEMGFSLSRDLLEQILSAIFARKSRRFFPPRFLVNRGNLSIRELETN